MLGELPDLKKIYLMGATGAGKSSLIQHIIGTTQQGFPSATQRRTTLATTEYVIQKDLPFQTTIILKGKAEIEASIEALIQAAILKAMVDTSQLDDVIYELQQSADERFKLKYIISPETFTAKAQFLLDEVFPLVEGRDINDETLFSGAEIAANIKQVIDDFLAEITANVKKTNGEDIPLFAGKHLIIDDIKDKEKFILANKILLGNEFGSISVLVDYVRIEGDLLADWFDDDLELVLIDGEGIGHSLSDKADTLSSRHFDYFNFCNNILLLGDAEDPFTNGAQGAIEAIYLSGYQDKLKLAFSKTDKIEQSDVNGYLRRNIANLKAALKKQEINFDIDNTETYQFASLNKENLDPASKVAIGQLLTHISNIPKGPFVPLEYDFNLFFADFDRDKTIDWLQRHINNEHWTTIKSLAKAIFNTNPNIQIQITAIILGTLNSFITYEINLFLKRSDELQSEINDSKNHIKQKMLSKTLPYIAIELFFAKQHLWQQAYEKSGKGSDKARKEFIINHIIKDILPSRDDTEKFEQFKQKMKSLLIESGAKELKSATKIMITQVVIKKMFGHKNISWSLGEDVNILIGKNGSGKSSILRLIQACIANDQSTLEYFGYPLIELTIVKEYDNGDRLTSTITPDKSSADIAVVMIDTFDNALNDLDGLLSQLVAQFGQYQRNLSQIINKKTEKLTTESKTILADIANASPEDLTRFQQYAIEINDITDKINKPLTSFKTLIDAYFADTHKTLITNNETSPLLITLDDQSGSALIPATQLSSGEKQLLIIFLTVMLQQNSTFILLMDEPETSLHVEWQSTFIDKIKAINPNIQIIAATHNPLILLNREQDEIGTIVLNNSELDNDEVQIASSGTKYLDISSILLNYFGLPSLIGADMQRDIKDFTALKLRADELNETEQKELERLKQLLEDSFAGDIIYNEKYFAFLRFLKTHKDIDFSQLESVNEAQMDEFMNDFGDFFND